MKHIKITALLFLAILYVTFTASKSEIPANKTNGYSKSIIDNSLPVTSLQLKSNNIKTWFRTNGSFNRDPVTGNSGFEWPINSNKFARYASGLWIGAKVNNDTLIAIAEYDYEYLPGYIDNFGIPQGNDNPDYRIFNFTPTDTSDYMAWRTIAAGQGAYIDSAGNPFKMGAQTMFYSYTDGYPDAHGNNAGSTLPLKAQILQTNWCYINAGTQDIAFTEFRVINRSSTVWTNAYIAIWTVDDLGDATDDAIASDTLRQLGYTYNYTNNDAMYGSNPPAVGTRVLRSPLIFTGNMNDTVKYFSPPGSNKLRIRVGYKYTKVPVFNTYTNGDPGNGDPANYQETYRMLQGLRGDGNNWINPTSGQFTKQTYSGDPVTGAGWNMTAGNDRRFMQSLGPLNMNPNDTQSIIIAQVVARGSSNLNSISQLRALSDLAQTLYDGNFQTVVSVSNISTTVPDKYSLSQNYPNPFNPVTNLQFAISQPGFVSLKVFDMLGKEVAALVNENLNPGTYKYNFDAAGLPSGVYFYTLKTAGFIETKRMMLMK
ncbi:MAG: T9SS type A sorting domain-containing protein [Ignavibacteria bacterium]